MDTEASPLADVREDDNRVDPDLPDGPTATDGGEEDDGGAPADRSGLSGWQIGVLVAAFLFLAGAAGYLVGGRTSGPPDSATDTGFLQDMIVHHEQAVTMASLAAGSASDESVRHMAREVLIGQRYEVGLMDAYLQARGKDRGDPNREVMTWMGPGLPMEDMPGLATPEQLDELRTADPDTQNILFLELMIRHHRGGIDMAEYASRRAEDPRVRDLAEVIARVQRQEVREYELQLEELTGG